MKRIIFLTILLINIVVAAAQGVDGMKVENLKMKRNGDYLAVNMDVDFSTLDVSSNRAVLFTPVLVNGNDSAELASVSFYGRRRHYYYTRNNKSILERDDERSFRASEKPDSIVYHTVLPYEPWMNGAHLVLQRSDYGCCNKIVEEQQSSLGTFNEKIFSPKYRYLRPAAERVKSRSLSGSAYIDFVVNKTVINPDYRNNRVEIAKIEATIDSVKNDEDMTITAVTIKGFASPEGSYENNERLAKGRTEALKEYVKKLYNFDENLIATSYEPEDWAGLRAYVAASDIVEKENILQLIDSSREPDNKEWTLKSTFISAYDNLYKNCYPALRRSDYKVEYTIRLYNDIEEIKRIFEESPQKLSLEEFFILSEGYDNDSRELNDIFETAVRMYPKDPTANLNAAISEMQNGDYKSAEPHLNKAGDSPEAIYARGVYAGLTKDYDKALTLLNKAKELGVSEAEDAIAQIEEIK